MSVVDALVAVGLVDSRNAARRAIGEGGASVNGTKVTDAERLLEAGDVLHDRVVVLRRGRKALAAGRLLYRTVERPAPTWALALRWQASLVGAGMLVALSDGLL